MACEMDDRVYVNLPSERKWEIRQIAAGKAMEVREWQIRAVHGYLDSRAWRERSVSRTERDWPRYNVAVGDCKDQLKVAAAEANVGVSAVAVDALLWALENEEGVL